ncbi:MAG TPA: hypothetical protein VFM61_07430 [Pseudidiomarina sp.]|nr:hypothetical protein [Pseudidiomarina sp.]
MKPIAHLSYLAVIMALAAYVWLQTGASSVEQIQPQPQSQPNSIPQEIVNEGSSAEVIAYIEELESEITSLRSALQTEIAARERREQADALANRDTTGAAAGTAEPAPSLRGRPFVDARDVHTLFAEEEIDPAWSAQHEQRLIDLMITDEGLRQYSVADVQCKTKTCRLTIYDDIEDPSSYTRELSRAVFQSNWEDQRFVTIMQQSENDDGKGLTLYLKKME